MTRAGLTPGRVVEVATEIIDDRGADALTLAEVASRLGVRTPSLYSHVDGIEALRQAVAIGAVDDLAEACRSASMGRAGAAALRAIAHAYREVALAHPGRYSLTQVARSDPAWEAAATRVLDPILAALGGMGISGDDAIDATRFMRSALHGFVLLETGGGFGLDVPIEESFQSLVDGVVTALAAVASG